MLILFLLVLCTSGLSFFSCCPRDTAELWTEIVLPTGSCSDNSPYNYIVFNSCVEGLGKLKVVC